MHRDGDWRVVRGAKGLSFASDGAGFELDTTKAADNSHLQLGSTFVIGERELSGAVELLGSCRVEEHTDGDGPHMRYTVQYLDELGEALAETKGKLALESGPFEILLDGERPERASRARLQLFLNKIFKLRVTLANVRLAPVDESSPLLDKFRYGYAWPGTTSMRWLDGKSMYVVAGCEMTYILDFLGQPGLSIHHTFAHQEAMDPVLEAANPTSEMWRVRPDFMVLSTVQSFRGLLSSHEQRRGALSRAELEQRLDGYVRELGDVISRLRERNTCPIWLFTLPYTSISAYGIHDYRIQDGSLSRTELILLLKLKLYDLCRNLRDVFLLDPDVALEEPGKGTQDAPLIRRNETIGGHPERAGSRYLAEHLHHQMLVVSKTTRRIKCVVVDCDNTLWEGVIREDGPARLVINKLRIQRLWHLALRGIPIALCTKNDPEDLELIMEALRSYGRLHEKIVTTRVDWQPKSVGIRSIAEQLNIGLDTVAFFDDSPFEREEVAANLPEVHVYPETAIDVAPEWHIFEPLGELTPEALDRVDKYRAEVNRSDYQESFSDDEQGFEQFLHSCELRLEVRLATGGEISRVSEILQRTNQMNATLKRLEAADVIAYHEDDTRAVHIVKLGDRFGDYGIIGTALSKIDGDRLSVVELALSCRAMGRRVEDALLEELIGFAADAELATVTIGVTRTSRNQQIISTLERVGFSAPDDPVREGTAETWTLELEDRPGRNFAAWFAWDHAIPDLE